MCGIVGYIGDRNAAEIILDGLRQLEYRGYDSAGLAVLNGEGLEIRRCPGKLRGLQALVEGQPVSGRVGLGHTRWATHGRPSARASPPAPRLPHRRPPRLGRGPAAQPGQERDG